MTVQQIVKNIRERYACGWELSDKAAKKLILDLIQKRVNEELSTARNTHECKEAQP
jgi:hypothetical protein